MVQTSVQATFQDYLRQQDSSARYELVRGTLIAMTPPTLAHIRIAKFLERRFDQEIGQTGQLWESFREVGQRTEANTSRLPDVVVATQAEAAEIINRSAIFETPVLLAVEIVSSNWQDDYLNKLAEHEALGISEYWIIDYLAIGAARYIGSPKVPTISIYSLVGQEYQVQLFRAGDKLRSTIFPDLGLTADEIFAQAQ
ncbi:MAG: Uma2 family endonuclease [Leptolyngbya sp. SIO4C1]|nr:Uma2 family endonuclease [Leptolyngbya sp. SIO4C1]